MTGQSGRAICPQPCIHLSAHDAREGRTCPEHPCTCPDEAQRRTTRLLREIDEAVEDYHHVFPPPAALAPNLDLAARAAVELRARHEFCGILCALRVPVGEGGAGQWLTP